MQYRDKEAQKALCALAIQSAKDKHLQQVLFYEDRAESNVKQRVGQEQAEASLESLYNPTGLKEGGGVKIGSLSCWVVSTTKV